MLKTTLFRKKPTETFNNNQSCHSLFLLVVEQIRDPLQGCHGEEEVRPDLRRQILGQGRFRELGHGGSVGAGAALGPAQIDEIPI